MNKIVKKEKLAERIYRLEVEAPLIAASRKAGNFIIARTGKLGERIPLTVVDSDLDKGTITLVVQEMGVSSKKICALNEGEYITDLVGPLGRPTDIKKVGTILACAGGLGAAPMLPIIKAFKEAGNRVITILAARSKDLLILKEELAANSDEFIIMTDDGTEGKKGLITVGMEEVIAREKIDECIAVGPGVMMKFCALTTKKHNIPTMVSLNAIMVDGTGMCGACRVTVGDETKFTCVDGPEFDAHKIDFDEFLLRLGGYKDQENVLLENFEKSCKLK
ncbi:ferredoxin--NADP+ reductase [Balneicella halophila]|uniref:Ferredoxin--NADP+ reductase n=1 Tax=Balneicella halophila TaxID=1537566 RepID=A0A7L4UPG3_BALHA|nr:ferredoxin--NADP+ reductase [Balneicella halophila]